MRAWGRLLRLSLAPTAAADIACGIVLGSAGVWPTGRAPWVLMLASLAVYHGAMALNDWADREQDTRERPDRPIPSGAVPAPAALGLAATLLCAGPWLAALAAGTVAALALGIVALCAAAYDLVGRGPLRGPLLLAACRGGNLAVGATAFGATGDSRLAVLAVPCLLYAGYVFFVSRLGRLEDGEERALSGAPRWLKAMGLALVAIPFLPVAATWQARALAALVAWVEPTRSWPQHAAANPGPVPPFWPPWASPCVACSCSPPRSAP